MSYGKNYKIDYEFGKGKELCNFDKINSYFKLSLTKSKDRYCSYDFFDKETFIELKSRRISTSAYKTTFCNSYKVQYFMKEIEKNNNVKFILVFSFTDGLFFINYDKELFNSFNSKTVYIQRRGVTVTNIEIPIEKLTKII